MASEVPASLVSNSVGDCPGGLVPTCASVCVHVEYD